jgi:hypothetical protein
LRRTTEGGDHLTDNRNPMLDWRHRVRIADAR